jgi:capsular exopolysaccharide synthesis family protein
MNEQTGAADQSEPGVDIRQYLALLWHWAWLIALAGILAGGSAYFFSKRITPVYEATTKVMVNEAPSTKTIDMNSIQTSQGMAATYTQMITTYPILSETAKQLNYTGDMVAFTNAVTVSPVTGTQILVITLRSTDPVFAAKAANTLVAVFAADVASIQADRFSVSKQNLQAQIDDMQKRIQAVDAQITAAADPAERDRLSTNNTQNRQIYSNLVLSYEQVRLSEAQTVSNIIPVEPARTPTAPVSPKVLQNTLLALLVGMLLAVGVVFAIDALDDTFRTPEEVTQRLKLPVLAVITHFTGSSTEQIMVESQPRAPVSEAFRTLRTNVQYTSVDNPMHTLLVTSAEPGEGKTTVTVNLAAVFAQGGFRVTVVDADLRHPSVHKRLGSPNQAGLSSIFLSQAHSLNGSVQPTRMENLAIISAGDIPPNPSELLGSQKMGQILSWVKEVSDIILLDTPPVLAVTDATVLAPLVDGVLLVIEPGVTRVTAARQMVEQLQRVNANIIGVVFNNLNLRSGRYGYRYYYYRGYYRNQYYNKYYTKEVPAKKNGKLLSHKKTEQ